MAAKWLLVIFIISLDGDYSIEVQDTITPGPGAERACKLQAQRFMYELRRAPNVQAVGAICTYSKYPVGDLERHQHIIATVIRDLIQRKPIF